MVILLKEPINIVFLGSVDESIASELKHRLMPYNIKLRFLLNEPEPSDSFYNRFRGQYKAEFIIDSFKKRVGRFIFITPRDLYSRTTSFLFSMREPEDRAIVSYFRMNPAFYGRMPDSEIMMTRLTKEVLHNIGLMTGLKYCSSPCIMARSTCIEAIDEKATNFCNNCRSSLTIVGYDV